MDNLKRVIKGLEVCTSKPCYCTDCPYKANCCLDSQEVMEDALALLKEYEVLKDQHTRLIQQKKELTQRITRLQEEKAYSSNDISDLWEDE